MIVLVTGANGLVGRHIVDKLSKEKAVVVIAQFQSDPLPSWCNNNISLLKTSFCNKNSSSLFDKVVPDVIVHCAAKIPTSAISSEDAANINRVIDSAIYNVALRHNTPVIFISSVIVYETSSAPYQEDTVLHPISPYALQKYESEFIFSALNKSSVSFRISSPYGGYQEPSRNVLYKFAHSALNGENLRVYGTGNRCQDFIYAADIADAVWDVIATWISGVELGGIYNIASASPISMKDLAIMIADIVGQGVVVISGEVDADEYNNPQIDIKKAYEEFSWQPSTSLAIGIRNVIGALRSSRCY